MLGETDYASEALAVDYEQAFEAELAGVYRFLRGLTNDPPELLVFLHRWDVHNLKLLVVTDGRGQPSKLGVIPFAELTRMIAAGDYTGLPQEIQSVLPTCRKVDRAAAALIRLTTATVAGFGPGPGFAPGLQAGAAGSSESSALSAVKKIRRFRPGFCQVHGGAGGD